MIKDYKDIFFCCWIAIWFTLDMTLWIGFNFTKDDMILVNLGMTLIFCVITLIKCKSSKFNNWLETKIKKDN